MKENQNPVDAAPVIQVQVTAVPSIDPITKKVSYNTTFSPEAVKVTAADTILSYELVAPTPAGVQFKSVKVQGKQPDQLSAPTISKSGKLLVMIDANTIKEVLNLTIRFQDADALEFEVDPEVDNDPGQDSPRDEAPPSVQLMPEVDNDPGQ